jgi:hypothetical protein
VQFLSVDAGWEMSIDTPDLQALIDLSKVLAHDFVEWVDGRMSQTQFVFDMAQHLVDLKRIVEAAPTLPGAGGGDEFPHWASVKPTCSGVYGVRGYQPGVSKADQFEAAVLVREYEGELVCNLHESTSEDNLDRWAPLSEISDKFEWLKFDYAALPPQQGG